MKKQPISHQQDIAENGNYAMLMHIFVFLPCINWLIVLIMWLNKKEESPLVRQHGNILMNLFLTVLIVASVFFLLIVITDRLLWDLLIVVVFLACIFFIVGLLVLMNIIDNAIRANKGLAGSYFMAFKFFDNKLGKKEITISEHLID